MNNQDLQAECNQKILNALKHISLTVCPFLSQKQQRQLSPKGKNDFKEKQFPDDLEVEHIRKIRNTICKTRFADASLTPSIRKTRRGRIPLN